MCKGLEGRRGRVQGPAGIFSFSCELRAVEQEAGLERLFFFLVALGLHCCAWAFSSCTEWGLLFLVVRGLLIAVASLVVEHGL